LELLTAANIEAYRRLRSYTAHTGRSSELPPCSGSKSKPSKLSASRGVCSSETSVNVYGLHGIRNQNLHSHRYKGLKSDYRAVFLSRVCNGVVTQRTRVQHAMRQQVFRRCHVTDSIPNADVRFHSFSPPAKFAATFITLI
jgi:hypothetical protein